MIKVIRIQFSKCKRNYLFEWKSKGVILIFLVAFFVTGCVMALEPQYSWIIEPHRQSVENEYFSASISPTAFNSLGRYVGYEAFDLTIKNNTSEDIELDWNKTIYIWNNQTKGGFMFEGVVYKDRNNPKQPDIIFSGSELRKTIWPNALVSFDRGWDHDVIPPGQNGVYLTVKFKDKEVKEKILLDMSIVPVQ